MAMGRYSSEGGQGGFDRIADTKIHHADWQANQDGNGGTNDASNTYHADVHKWVAIKVIGSAVVDETGTVAVIGDVPISTDSLTDTDIIPGPFSKIQLASGVVYAYRSLG